VHCQSIDRQISFLLQPGPALTSEEKHNGSDLPEKRPKMPIKAPKFQKIPYSVEFAGC
jgi:hypothetical protein